MSVTGTTITNTGGSVIKKSGLLYNDVNDFSSVNNLTFVDDNVPADATNSNFTTTATIKFNQFSKTYYIKAFVVNEGGLDQNDTTAYSTQTIKLELNNTGAATFGPALI